MKQATGRQSCAAGKTLARRCDVLSVEPSVNGNPLGLADDLPNLVNHARIRPGVP